MEKEINVLALVKGQEQYIFLYDDNHRTETLRLLGRYAADPQLSFSWYDAAILSKKLREMAANDQQQLVPSQSNCINRHVTKPRFSIRQEEDTF